MLVIVFGMFIEVKLVQFLKIPSLRVVRLDGIFALVAFLHPAKASMPIEVTPLGKEILCKLEQSMKADDSIVFSVLGKDTLASLVQSRNASLPILVMPSGIFMDVRLLQP